MKVYEYHFNIDQGNFQLKEHCVKSLYNSTITLAFLSSDGSVILPNNKDCINIKCFYKLTPVQLEKIKQHTIKFLQDIKKMVVNLQKGGVK